MTENHFTFANDSAHFKADSEKRTVEGVILPFGVVGRNIQGKFRFVPGSVEWPKSTISRVKLNKEHDRTDLLGAATDIRANDEGLSGKFKVKRGSDGDQALMDAEDAVLDGFSVEVDILEFAPDSEDPSINVVSSARLTGVALTGSPAFSDARLTSVHASNPGDTEMTDAPTPAVAPDVSAIADAIREGFSNLPVAAPAAVPTFTSVSEEKPYRFNGEKGAHEFSGDVFSAAKGDGESKARLEQFMRGEFAVGTGNVSSVNPTQDRPDMYVRRLTNTSPLTDALYKGPLSDGTPFRWAEFNAAAGLVADHVEGVEPTGGSFSTKAVGTVTPSALSGKVEINREVIDAGGNPQLSTEIWRTITEDYTSAIETKAANFLAGLTLTGSAAVTITTGAANGVLATEVEAFLAGLQFKTGGMREDVLLTHANLHLALLAARDSTNRPMYPVIGATNANGQVAPGFGSVAVGPMVARPAWSLGAKSVNTGNSYAFCSGDLNLWASAPTRFDFQYKVATVEIAVWGYVATAASRLSHVTRIGYDPVV